MARQPRLVVPGVAMHIVQRGNNRSDCFVADTDRLVYIVALRELAAKHRCAVHAYCLMTNHVHLLLTPADEGGCSRLMRDLGLRYVHYYNRRHARTGTLWEGRFRSCLVESASYVLACYRYIERNPVEAGMVRHPEEYPWSSFHANARGRLETLVQPHAEYLALAQDTEARRASYAAMLLDAMDPLLVQEIRAATHAGYPLASQPLKDELRRKQTLQSDPDPTLTPP